MELTLQLVLQAWDSREHTIEEKLELMEKHVFEWAGLKHDPQWYVDNGKFFQRYIAGFLSRYFDILKDLTFLIVDPMHIISILMAFVKNMLTHPIRTLKQIWSVWTSTYTHGAYGLGAITADALMAAIIAGGAAAIAEGSAAATAEAAGQKLIKETVSGATALPQKVAKVGEAIGEAIQSHEELFDMVMSKPKQVLADAAATAKSGVNFGQMERLRTYAQSLIKGHHKTQKNA